MSRAVTGLECTSRNGEDYGSEGGRSDNDRYCRCCHPSLP